MFRTHSWANIQDSLHYLLCKQNNSRNYLQIFPSFSLKNLNGTLHCPKPSWILMSLASPLALVNLTGGFLKCITFFTTSLQWKPFCHQNICPSENRQYLSWISSRLRWSDQTSSFALKGGLWWMCVMNGVTAWSEQLKFKGAFTFALCVMY